MAWSGVALKAECQEVSRIRCGVGRGNKFVLLDMTEEPEAKKLTVYNTNENLMER